MTHADLLAQRLNHLGYKCLDHFVSIGIFFGYCLLLYFFTKVDVYHHHFFDNGTIIIIYNVARIAFIFYLFWIFYAVGYFFLCIFSPEIKEAFSLNPTLLSFFSGVGVWHILLFAGGFFGLYNYKILSTVTVFIFLFSYPLMKSFISVYFINFKNIFSFGVIIFFIITIIFIMIKGLYPAGGHDYYTHYFQYYKRVIETGYLYPNEVWYQFYYSKGAGLFFLSMLLTDPLAPQLASTLMILSGAGVVYSILREKAAWGLLPWLAASLYVAFLIYTPGPFENMRQGGWGDLEKPHEPAAVLVLANLWLMIQIIQGKSTRVAGITLILSTLALTLISQAMAIFIIAFLSILSIFFMVRKLPNVFWLLISNIAAISMLGLILLVNYFLTGLPQDQSLFRFESLVNLQLIDRWGVLFNLLLLHWAKTGLIANQIPITLNFILDLFNYLRLDIWWPFAILSIILTTIGIIFDFKKIKNFDKLSLGVISAFLIITVFLSLAIGRDQPISFYRFTTFTYAPTLCLLALLLSGIIRRSWFGSILLILICFGVYSYHNNKSISQLFDEWGINSNNLIKNTSKYDIDNLSIIYRNAENFIIGKYSILQAYQHQEGWPGRMPFGGIYPPLVEIWQKLPKNESIWSMHVHSYCMLPGCKMLGYMSSRLTTHAEKIFFDQPDVAKKYLKDNHLNYFFYSNELQLTDPLPLAPLFNPEHIAKYLGIYWTDGVNYLLTWQENSTTKIDAAWLKKYSTNIREASVVKSFPYNELKSAFMRIQHTKKINFIQLPWYHAGWK